MWPLLLLLLLLIFAVLAREGFYSHAAGQAEQHREQSLLPLPDLPSRRFLYPELAADSRMPRHENTATLRERSQKLVMQAEGCL